MSVTPLTTGKYLVRVREAGRGSKQHTKIVDQFLEAVEYEAFLLKRFGKAPNAGLTIRELAERYEHFYMPRLKSAHSKKEKMDQLVIHFGKYKVCAFNSMLVEQYQDKLIAAKKAPATVNHLVANLKAMFSWAEDHGACTKEINQEVHKVKMLPENNQRLRYLTRAEADTLVEKCADYIRPIVILALNTGMRKAEIMGLKWIQVDLTNRVILLDQASTKNKARREIPLNETAIRTLKGLMRHTENDRVFWNVPEYWRKAFHGALRRSRINDFKFHDLRHTFASWLVQGGAPLKVVQELLGHKTLTMTLRYAHLAPDNRRDAVMMLDGEKTQESQRCEPRGSQK
jgi:integrase